MIRSSVHCMASVKKGCRDSCICRDGGDCAGKRSVMVGNTGRLGGGYALDLTVVGIMQVADW